MSLIRRNRRRGIASLAADVDAAGVGRAGPSKLFLSAHDTCDHGLGRMAGELHAETVLLKAGQTCRL